jgi:FMN-dependent NADH-azoreductase
MNLKTLVVSYIPLGKDSSTNKILDYFLSNATDTEIEVLDLLVNVPVLLLEENTKAYYKRNYLDLELTHEQENLLAPMDALTDQFIRADIVVLAYPMFNFSFPSVVKAYFDAVIQKNKTFDIIDGKFVGKLHNKKALVLSTTGANYLGNNSLAMWDHSMPLSHTLFSFLGFEEIQLISAQGLIMHPDEREKSMREAERMVREITSRWYTS